MAANSSPYPELGDGQTYLDKEARSARANHVVRNDYNDEAPYPDNLESYQTMVGANIFDFKA